MSRLVLAALAALTLGACVDQRAGGGLAPVDDVVAPTPAAALRFRVGRQLRDAVEVARDQALRVHVIAVDPVGLESDVTELATLTSDDPAVAAVAAPGRIAARAATAATTIRATFDDATSAALELRIADRPCRPVIDVIRAGRPDGAGDAIRVINPCTVAVARCHVQLYAATPSASGSYEGGTVGQMVASELAPGAAWLVEPSAPWALGTDGAIVLRHWSGAIVDVVGFGALAAGHPYVERAPAPALAAGLVLSRVDNIDTGDNSEDFALAAGGCSELGCPIAPSGSPDAWEPCEDEVCYCGAPARACAP